MYKCKQCEKVFEKWQSMAAHTTSHSQQWRVSMKKLRKPPITEKRNCRCCGKEFTVNIRTWHERKHSRRYCSRHCAHTRESKYLQPNLCKYCGKVTFKKTYKWCSQECRTEYIHKEYIRKWLSGEKSGNSSQHISPHVRRYMLEQANYKCSKCNWEERHPKTGNIILTVHHKDGNHKNSRPENLEVLCPNHHALTETYGNLNKGHGRDYRYRWKNAG